MKADAAKVCKIIKKCPRLLSIIDVTKYPMMAAEYRRIFSMCGNPYVDACLRKLCSLGIFRVPSKARYGKVLVFTETGREAKRLRCKELGREYDYCESGMQSDEYRIYSEVASSRRRRKIIKAMREEYETFTQIYRKTKDFSFDTVNRSLRHFLDFGIVVQEKPRGRYRLNKKGVKIRDFINKIDEIQESQEKEETAEFSY